MDQLTEASSLATKPTAGQIGSMRDTIAMLNAHMNVMDTLFHSLECNWTTETAAENIEEYISNHNILAKSLAISLLGMGYGDGSSISYARRSVLLRWAAGFDLDLQMTIIQTTHREGVENGLAA